MSATLQRAFAEVTQGAIPRKKPRGQVCAFTRHPTALATALATLTGMHLRPAVDKLARILLSQCDREGLYWGGIGSGKLESELEALTKLRHHTIRKAARELRALGLIDWTWVKPFGRFPLRESYRVPAKLARGRRTAHGGRVWTIQWEKFGVPFVTRTVGTKSGGLIHRDQSGVIRMDQSSDPLGSPSELLSSDPAPGFASVASAAPPPDRAGVARTTRNPESESEIAPPPAADVARESRVSREAAPPAPRSAPRLAPEGRDRELERGGSTTERPRGEPARPSVAEMQAMIASAFAPRGGGSRPERPKPT